MDYRDDEVMRDEYGTVRALRVRRAGGRGWHWIDPSSFDPARHQRMSPTPPPQVVAPEPVKRGPGRPRKNPTQGVS